MHSIFITNGLGICSARRFADLWQAGLLHFITARKSRERERDSLSDPARNPSMHWGSKEQGPCHRRAISFDSSDSHCALGGFTASVFDIGFPSRRGVRCLFGDYLPCMLKWLFFCFVSSTDGQALTAFLAFDCYMPSSERQLGFRRLSKESWRVYVWRFFFQFPQHQIFALVFICNASSSCDSIRKSRYSLSASDISIIFPISAHQHRVRKTKCLCTILFSKRLKTRNECKNPRRLSLNDRSAPLLSATPSATRDDRRRRNEILQRRKSGEALP